MIAVYDKKYLIKNIFLFLMMIICMYPTQGAGFAIVWAFAFSALIHKQHERFLLIMLLMVGAQVGNSYLMPKGTFFHIVHKSLMLFLAVVVIIYFNFSGHISPLMKPFLLIMPYILYMILPSCFGWNPIVSCLKLILFLCCYIAFLGIANVVILEENTTLAKIRSIFLSLCCFSLLGSILLIPFPSISQMTGEEYVEALKTGEVPLSLFKGILFHSQTLGPLSAMLFIAMFSDFIMSVKKTNKLYFSLLICAPLLIYITSSRTAMGTLVAGIIFSIYLFFQSKQIEYKWKSSVMRFLFLFGIVSVIIIFFNSSFQEGVSKYILKKQTVKTLRGYNVGDILFSRQNKIDQAIINFKKKPLIGNGFQVSEYMSSTSGWNTSVLSAPVEKSVWVTAVLEEGGVAGLILFVCFGLFAIHEMVRQKAYISAIMLFSMFVVNLGEFFFFSMSGAGGFCWALCFMTVVIDAQRLREDNERQVETNMPGTKLPSQA